MKKYFKLSLLVVFLLTGCRSKLTCTLKENDEDFDTVQEIVFEVNDKDIVEKADINYTMVFKTNEEADNYYKVLETFENNYKLSIEKNKISIKDTNDYKDQKETVSSIKEEFIKNGYTCK